MSERPSISIVMPAHNERDNLHEVVSQSVAALRRETDDYEVVIVDDASTDDTLQLAEQIAAGDPEHIRVIPSVENIGCHRAALLGLRSARSDWLFFIPADLQIRPDQLHRCMPATGDADYVVTNRAKRADPVHRRLMSRGYNAAVRLAFGLRVHDVDSSILVRRTVVEDVAPELEGDSDFIPVEMLARAVGKGYRMTEVAIDHHPRVAGQPTALTPREAARTLMKLGGSLLRMRSVRRLTRRTASPARR